MTRRPAYALASALLLASCAGSAPSLEPAPTRVEPPPPDTLVKPGPNAENELDPALFAGLPPQARAELGIVDSNANVKPKPPGTAGKAPAPKKPPRKGAQAVKIATVAVLGVKGAPGKGNAELARALRLVLRKAGWPVYPKKRRDSMTITGRVEMGPKTPRGQRVRLKWTVKAPNGRLLGVIEQSNVVESGSLDRGFGPAALPAAEGAAEGIFKLVRRLRRG
jgi:hypothetical protein